jgi:glycosyltransferase involved in cell wall biosynthesis
MARYSALIRTFNSADTLPDTLRSLAAQTIPPSTYIFVDSGSADNTFSLFPDGSIVHKFVGHQFNFATAINQGLSYVSTEYILIISAHTMLRRNNSINYALNLLMENDKLGGAYFSNENNGELTHVIIDRQNFNGFNGLWNTCSIIKASLLKRRNFREDVFSAEDQEWARWLLFSESKVIARVNGAGMDNSSNVRMWKYDRKKRKNEYVSIAYFTNRDLLKPRNLVRIGYRIVKPTTSFRERYFNVTLLGGLLGCFLRKPKYKSRYF